MPIIVNLDVMMARRKISAGELAERVGITPANLSILKNNKARAVRFSTLEALCRELDCQPADLLEYREEDLCRGAVSTAAGQLSRSPQSFSNLWEFYWLQASHSLRLFCCSRTLC